MKTLVSLILSSTFSLSAFALNFSAEVPKNIRQQMTADLTLVKGMFGNDGTVLYRKVYGGAFSGTKLTQFFNTRIQKVGLSDCGGGNGVAACVDTMTDPNVMLLTKMYTTAPFPQIARISILFHEARHSETEKDNWSHIDCPSRGVTGKPVIGKVSGRDLTGEPACDNTVFGAYGIQILLLKNIEFFCTNCSEKTKMDAKIFGDDTLDRITDPTSYQSLILDLKK